MSQMIQNTLVLLGDNVFIPDQMSHFEPKYDRWAISGDTGKEEKA